MKNIDIQGQIKDLSKMILQWEIKQGERLKPNVRMLRERILFAHMRTEASMELFITFRIIGVKFHQTKKEELDNKLKLVLTQNIVERLGYYEKYELCQSFKLIDSTTLIYIRKLNEYRNKFAHEKNYKNKIKEYGDVNKQLELLQNIVKVFTGLSEEFSRLVNEKSNTMVEEIMPENAKEIDNRPPMIKTTLPK
jgi:hypothetical protein